MLAWQTVNNHAGFIIHEELINGAKGLNERLWDQRRVIEQKHQAQFTKENKPQFIWRAAKGLELR